MTLKYNRAPLPCWCKLCASFYIHWWIQNGVTVRKPSIRVKISHFFVPCDLEIWWMTLKDNRAPLLCCFKLCASCHSHWWIQTGVTVRKRLNGVMTSVTFTFDHWPWPFARTSRLPIVITTENFRMIRWQTEISVLRAAWSQLKMIFKSVLIQSYHISGTEAKRLNNLDQMLDPTSPPHPMYMKLDKIK